MQTEKLRTPVRPFRNERHKSLQYVRYADDFIIGIIGSKADATRLKAELGQFLKDDLKLVLSDAKTKITHTTKRARFLGYDITITHDQGIKRIKGSNGKLTRARVHNGKAKLLVPHEKWVNRLISYKAIMIESSAGNKERFKATARRELVNSPDIGILTKYNAETRGFCNYYRIAANASTLWNVIGLMKWSMLKTFAKKYRTKCKKIKDRYCKGGAFSVTYDTKHGVKSAKFIHSIKSKDDPWQKVVGDLPLHNRYGRVNTMAARLKTRTCELCGRPNRDLEMHQVKRLKDLRGLSQWELKMLNKRRKTLAVCHDCHTTIHATGMKKAG